MAEQQQPPRPPQPLPKWLPPPNIQQFQQQFQNLWWPAYCLASDTTLPAAWFRLAEATFHCLHVLDPSLQFA